MRSCPACGTSNAQSAKFCAECGARLPASIVDEEQRKTVTILFCDVTGSTSLGERLEPESLRRMLSRFFEAARTVVDRHGGTVEKFIGDAVMAVFGVPVVHEDDAVRALRAALDLLDALDAVNLDLQREFGAALQIRIGVSSGDVVTGTSERLATGDAVNVAARLEQLAMPGDVYVGELTVQLAGAAAGVVELDPAVLKGKAAPVRVFRLESVGSDARPVRATPMVGRKRQVDRLRAAFDHAVTDRACVLFTVLGAAGVGKSRLVAEFLTGLDVTVLQARCLSYGSGVGLLPAAQIVRQLQQESAAVPGLLDGDPAVATAIRALLAGDLAVRSITEIAWAVRKLLERAAAVRPLVVVVDDLHWAEPPLFDVIEHVVTLSRDAPILVLAMARPELLERREKWGAGALNASTVLLEPLAPEETAELIELLAPSLDIAAQARVREAAAGNPLFAEEMVALIETSGNAGMKVPPTISALLAARLDQLDPEERRALERGSIEGQSFHRGAVAALGPDDPDLPRRLIDLVRKDLLRPEQSSLDRDEAYRFRHLLLRDAAYARLPKSVRADLHERFARWLDDHATALPERDSLVGYHLEQAYRFRVGLGPVDDAASRLAAEAAARLETAGRRQMARRDLVGAVDLLGRASSLVSSDRFDPSLELGIAQSLVWSGRAEEGLARAAATVEAATRSGDRRAALHANIGRAVSQFRLGAVGVAEVERVLAGALREFEAAGDDAALAWYWFASFEVAHGYSRFADAMDAIDNMQLHAQRAGDPYLTYSVANRAVCITYGPTPVPEALQMLTELDAGHGSDPWCDIHRAELLSYVGRFDEARELQAGADAAFRDRGLTLTAAMYRQTKWEIETAAGDLAAAVAAGRDGCAELEELGDRSHLTTNATQLAESLYFLGGHDDEAEHWIDLAVEVGDPEDLITQCQAAAVRALLAVRRGDPDGAVAGTRDALRMTAQMQCPMWQGRTAMHAASVYSTVGDRDAAHEQLRRALDFFTAKGSTVYAGRATEALAALGG